MNLDQCTIGLNVVVNMPGTNVRKHGGKVVGMGWVTRSPESTSLQPMIPLVIVQLEEGYYDPHGGWVALMTVHPENLEET